MKVFVYDKKDNTTLDIITDVKKCIEAKHQLRIYTTTEVIIYNTKYVKTRIYQN